MQKFKLGIFNEMVLANISSKTRMFSLGLISMAMMAITVNFYIADAVYLRASVLPVYILFFIMIYMGCVLVEYASLWCKREKKFHCARVLVHSLALVLVSYETGVFFSSDRDVYSHFPTYSVTNVLSQFVLPPEITVRYSSI